MPAGFTKVFADGLNKNSANALAVSACGMGVERSVVLDAWRDSGNLFFTKLTEDKSIEVGR